MIVTQKHWVHFTHLVLLAWVVYFRCDTLQLPHTSPMSFKHQCVGKIVVVATVCLRKQSDPNFWLGGPLNDRSADHLPHQ